MINNIKTCKRSCYICYRLWSTPLSTIHLVISLSLIEAKNSRWSDIPSLAKEVAIFDICCVSALRTIHLLCKEKAANNWSVPAILPIFAAETAIILRPIGWKNSVLSLLLIFSAVILTKLRKTGWVWILSKWSGLVIPFNPLKTVLQFLPLNASRFSSVSLRIPLASLLIDSLFNSEIM